MNKGLDKISNIEKFCKKYHIEELASKEELTFDDYKRLMESMLKDSNTHARNIKIIKNVSSGLASIGGAVSGIYIIKGIKDHQISDFIISAGVAITSIFGVAYAATKLTQKELDSIRDNAIFAEGIVSGKSEVESMQED